MDLQVTAPPRDADGRDQGRPHELSEREVARLRAAGGWARFLARTGAVGFGLLLLFLLDVGLRNPAALINVVNAQYPTIVASGILFVVAGIGAIPLLWGYARNVAAFFARGEDALPRAFRRIRHFVILWTVVTALTAFFEFIAVWQRF
jgi:hypothetical protein